MKKLILSLTCLAAMGAQADEGMWTLYDLPQAVYEQMKMEGYQLPYEMLYKADDAIMKSVVNFSGYCSPMGWCSPTITAALRLFAATAPWSTTIC